MGDATRETEAEAVARMTDAIRTLTANLSGLMQRVTTLERAMRSFRGRVARQMRDAKKGGG